MPFGADTGGCRGMVALLFLSLTFFLLKFFLSIRVLNSQTICLQVYDHLTKNLIVHENKETYDVVTTLSYRLTDRQYAFSQDLRYTLLQRYFLFQLSLSLYSIFFLTWKTLHSTTTCALY